MNKIGGFMVFTILFFLGLLNTLAFEANLQLDKTKSDINEYINLRLELKSDEGGQIGITEIKGIENFDIINQSQSQSSSSNIVVNNGKSETKTESSINLDMTLKAKSKGDFEIGPATLTDGSGQVLTNIVKITVTGDQLFVNNNHLNVNTQNNTGTNTNTNLSKSNQNNGNTIQNNTNKPENQIGDYENIDKLNFENDKNLYLLVILLFFIGLTTYYIFKKNPELLEKIINLEKQENKVEEPKNTSHNIIIKSQEKITEISNFSENKIEKEKNIPEKMIKIPDLSDPDFLFKIDKFFRQNISLKYNVPNIENKTYAEILSSIEIEKIEKIEEIINLLNKAKYSNQYSDNEKILELIKNI